MHHHHTARPARAGRDVSPRRKPAVRDLRHRPRAPADRLPARARVPRRPRPAGALPRHRDAPAALRRHAADRVRPGHPGGAAARAVGGPAGARRRVSAPDTGTAPSLDELRDTLEAVGECARPLTALHPSDLADRPPRRTRTRGDTRHAPPATPTGGARERAGTSPPGSPGPAAPCSSAPRPADDDPRSRRRRAGRVPVGGGVRRRGRLRPASPRTPRSAREPSS